MNRNKPDWILTTALSITAVIMAVALAMLLCGCSTAAEQACQSGTPMAGYTIGETCAYAMAERAQINSEIAAGAAVAAVGLGTYAAIEANRPRTQTYLVTPTGPFSNNYMISGPYGE